MIEFNNIHLQLGNTSVLHSINLSIAESGMTAIIGPNGAGKSSLLSLMTQSCKPQKGNILIDNIALTDLPRRKLATYLSVLRQDNHLQARLKVKELISFGRFPYHQGNPSQEDWHKIKEVMALLELEGYAERYVDELSGGQRQRAYVAMVLAQDTQYLFLDEPLNSLDMRYANSLMQCLRNITDQQNKSIILVLHDINYASYFCDRIIALKDGKVFTQGHRAEVMQLDILTGLYDMPLTLHQIGKKALCLPYFADKPESSFGLTTASY